MVACCPSHAASSNMRGTRGVGSSSNTSAARRPCLRSKAVIWRVRERMMLDGRYSPPGIAARTWSHSWGVRFFGSSGHAASTPPTTSARHFTERKARPACSWAMRTIRSLTFTPSSGAVVQPRRRSAIHAFDGSFLPPASCPAARTSTSVVFQCPASSVPVIRATSPVHQPTRFIRAAAVRSSPVLSSTPVRMRARAHAVREVSPSARDSFRLTRHGPGRCTGRTRPAGACGSPHYASRTGARRTSSRGRRSLRGVHPGRRASSGTALPR